MISGSITRLPYRLKYPEASLGSPKISATETTANGTIQIVGLMNSTVRPVTVAMSVTKVADISRFPTSSPLNPVSTRTAYTTARLVVESASPAISD